MENDKRVPAPRAPEARDRVEPAHAVSRPVASPVMPARSAVTVNLRLPTATIIKGLGAAFLLWAGLRLWPEVVYLSISLIMAIALEPSIAWLCKRGLSRATSVLLMALLLAAGSAAIAFFVLPPLVEQLVQLANGFPAFQARVLRRLPTDDRVLRTVVEQVFALPASPEFVAEMHRPLLWGRVALNGLLTTFFVIVATLYLLLDGRRMYAWLLAYVPRTQREKMARTVPEVSDVIQAYVRGQVITSLLVAVFSALLLAWMDVPAVAPLAVLAGVCDVIPVVGIVIATAPAALLALTVSPVTAAIVVVSYFTYHLFETYVIVPRVYGSSLRISTLTVLLALIVGSTLQGVLGAALILPIVAAYPIIERIWLKNYLAREVLADHKALAKAAETGDDDAVEAVLQGEKHADERHTDEYHVPLPGE